ncbi:hypothetical protein TNCV_539801 [Trichonephila clavipes]|nr:hypothetical protein TNCV_539801 [Trichonephila clavipes]
MHQGGKKGINSIFVCGRCETCGKSFVACKRSMVTAIYRKARSTKGWSASKKGRFVIRDDESLDSPSTSTTEDHVQVVEGIVRE